MKIKARKIFEAFLFVLIIVYLFAYGCSVYGRGKQKIETKYAQENAKRFIAEKYGIESEAITIKQNSNIELVYFKASDKEKLVPMTDGEKIFIVEADSKKNSYCISDSYQYDQIREAVLCEVFEICQGSLINFEIYDRAVSPSIRVGSRFCDLDHLFRTKYDGSNLKKVLENKSGFLEMVFYSDVNIDQELFEKMVDLNLDCRFTVFDSEEHMNEYVTARSHDLSDKSHDELYQSYTSQIIRCIEIENGQISVTQ